MLILAMGAVGDTVTAQYGGEADVVRTLVVACGAAALRGEGTRYGRGATLFVRLVKAVKLTVALPAPGDTLKGVDTLEVLRAAGQRLWSHRCCGWMRGRLG